MPAPLAQSARDQLHRSFGDDPGYIQALANAVSAHWQRHGQADRLVLSFHGIPRRALIWATLTTANATRPPAFSAKP
jgi:hypothetical protein